MTPRRRVLRRTAFVAVAALACVGFAAGPGAADTGVSGTVDSVVSLSLQRTAPDEVAATVSATIAPTALRATPAGEGTRTVKTYNDPVAGTRTTVRATGDGELTITYGPAGP